MINYVKISEEDLKLAEEFFENEKHFAEFIFAVVCNYRDKNYQIKTKIVQKYFNSYQKTMKRVKIGITTGGLRNKKNKIEVTDNQRVYDDYPSRVPITHPITHPQTQIKKENKEKKINKVNKDFDKFLIFEKSVLNKTVEVFEKYRSLKDKNYPVRLVAGKNTEETIQNIIFFYNNHCMGLLQNTKNPDETTYRIKNILAKYPLEAVEVVLLNAGISELLNGGENKTGWKADLSWLMQEDKFINTLEQKYGSWFKHIKNKIQKDKVSI